MLRLMPIFGFSILALGSVNLVSCKFLQKMSKTNAIVSADGKSAFGLLILRNAYQPETYTLFDDDASKVENALRLQLAPVECTGENAGAKVNQLEVMAAYNPDMLRREGRTILSFSPAHSAPIDGCKAVGNYSMGGGSLVRAFETTPKTQDEFEVQQAIWLAARGRSNMDRKVFGVQFYNFLSENLGAVPTKDFNDVAAGIEALDALFNPCVEALPAVVQFKKEMAYLCDQRSNYQVRGDYTAVRSRLTTLIDKYEGEYLQTLAANSGSNQDVPHGIEAKLKLDSTIKTLALSGRPAGSGALALGNPDSIPAVPSNAIVDVIKPRAAAFELLFRIKLGSAPTPTFSFSNPRKVDTPPDAAAVTNVNPTSGGMQLQGLSLGGRSSRRGNWIQSQRSNYYYASNGYSNGYPSYTTYSAGQRSNGGTTGTQTSWLYQGQASRLGVNGENVIEYMWKRANDSSIYYADLQGNVKRTSTNSQVSPIPNRLPNSGNSGLGSGSGQGSGTLGGNGNIGGNGAGAGSGESELERWRRLSQVNPNGNNQASNGGQNSVVKPNPQVIPKPAVDPRSESDIIRDGNRQKLGWDKATLGEEANVWITRNGNTLDSFHKFRSGVDGFEYAYGDKAMDEARGAAYTGRRFDCQDFTATDLQAYYELTGIKPRAIEIFYQQEKIDPKTKKAMIGQDGKVVMTEVGHSVGVYPVGTNAKGQTLYQTRESQFGAQGKKEPFTEEGMSEALRERNGISASTGGFKLRNQKTYDPSTGAKSVMFNDADSQSESWKKETHHDDPNNREPLLTDKGGYNWKNAPNKDQILVEDKKAKDEAQRAYMSATEKQGSQPPSGAASAGGNQMANGSSGPGNSGMPTSNPMSDPNNSPVTGPVASSDQAGNMPTSDPQTSAESGDVFGGTTSTTWNRGSTAELAPTETTSYSGAQMSEPEPQPQPEPSAVLAGGGMEPSSATPESSEMAVW